MPIILVGCEKGGSGKTTLATNLAALRQTKGFETLIIDADAPQLTSSLWAATRNDTALSNALVPHILCMQKSGKLAWDVLKLQEKYDTIIIDAGGRESMELRYAMAICDVAVMPFRPSQFDTWTADTMAKIIREAKEAVGDQSLANPNRFKAVLNAVNPNPMMREHEEVRALLEEYRESFITLPIEIRDRVSIRRAAREGLGVAELAGANQDAKATEEFENLYAEVFNG